MTNIRPPGKNGYQDTHRGPGTGSGADPFGVFDRNAYDDLIRLIRRRTVSIRTS